MLECLIFSLCNLDLALFMKQYKDLVAESLQSVPELFPWDLDAKLACDQRPLLLDVREPAEFLAMHIEHSIHVPRGNLEAACEWDYDDTIPELVLAREKEVVVMCRSGQRSALAARTLQLLGFNQVYSLKTGLRGWNDSDLPLVDQSGQSVDPDIAETFLRNKVRDDQKSSRK